MKKFNEIREENEKTANKIQEDSKEQWSVPPSVLLNSDWLARLSQQSQVWSRAIPTECWGLPPKVSSKQALLQQMISYTQL